MTKPALRMILSLTALLLATTAALKADWKVLIERKPNQITGLRNAQAQVGAKGLQTSTLVLGCQDGKLILRVVDRFRGFRFPGGSAPVKVRPSEATVYLDFQAPVNVTTAGESILFLDDKLSELLPKMKSDPLLLVQVPYQDKDVVVTFPMMGLEAALAKLGQSGCHL